ncbi:MAG: PDR/VanB family oxidoreductase [Actinomycetales bacterium]
MHTLTPGTRLTITQPLQNFPLGVGAERYILVAGGIGITALIGMAAALRSRKAHYEMHYVGRDRSVMAYLDELAQEHPDELRVYVDSEGTPLEVDRLLDSVAEATTEMYMCGPIRLMDAIRRGWADRGLPETNLRFETFGNSGSWDPEPFVVSIPAQSRQVRVEANESMLDALERAGVDIMSDCRKGECGLCQVKVLDLSGRIDHRDVFFSQAQKDASEGLCACVSRVVAGVPDLGPVDRDEDLASRAGSSGAAIGAITVELP